MVPYKPFQISLIPFCDIMSLVERVLIALVPCFLFFHFENKAVCTQSNTTKYGGSKQKVAMS